MSMLTRHAEQAERALRKVLETTQHRAHVSMGRAIDGDIVISCATCKGEWRFDAWGLDPMDVIADVYEAVGKRCGPHPGYAEFPPRDAKGNRKSWREACA
jgi:heterodisulfide reductase subunit A-like polyferredoxin